MKKNILEPKSNCCYKCGAGLNGNEIYRGKLIKEDPFNPLL